jgi:outer membrane protein
MRAAGIELIRDAELTLARRTAQHESIAALARAGVRPTVDEQRAKVEVVVAQANVEIRKNNLASLEAALTGALGEDPLAPVRAATLESDALGQGLSPRDAVMQGLANRPEVRAREAVLKASKAKDDAARGARLPVMGVAGSTSMTRADVVSGEGLAGQIFSASAWLYVRWNALDATVWRQPKVTTAAVREAERALSVAQLNVRNEVVMAALAVQNAKFRLDQSEQVLAGAQITRTAQNERYRAGVATLLELLDAEALEQSARLQRIEAEREYAIARANLLSATGQLTQLDD